MDDLINQSRTGLEVKVEVRRKYTKYFQNEELQYTKYFQNEALADCYEERQGILHLWFGSRF